MEWSIINPMLPNKPRGAPRVDDQHLLTGRTSAEPSKPEKSTTDGLRSYRATMTILGNTGKQEVGRWANNRMENSHLPFRRRERVMWRFRQIKLLQKFASVHANVRNHFNLDRQLTTRQNYKIARSAALAEWQNLLT